MKISKNYNMTIKASYVGYVTQAIVCNFAPLLYVSFNRDFGLSLSQISAVSAINFFIQLVVDGLSTKFVDRIGYRISVVAAHAFASVGLVALGVLPYIMPPFTGILIAILIYGSGSGLIEVLVSPIVEACPTPRKEAAMSLLHSFYCWGHVGVVLVSTCFFKIFGIENWKILTCIWVLIPVCNSLIFLKTPIAPLGEEGEKGLTLPRLFRNKIFWILMLMMLCAGASEQSVSQWASTFAEKGLGVSKTIGDLAGPMTFAILMGSARAFYGKFGEKIDLDKFMLGSSVLCAASYLCISLSPSPVLSLIGCGICGLSVGIMWPGTFSKASSSIRNGGTALFALLALAGDLGCSGGPTVVGAVSSLAADDLKKGILAAIIFPLLLFIGILLIRPGGKAGGGDTAKGRKCSFAGKRAEN